MKALLSWFMFMQSPRVRRRRRHSAGEKGEWTHKRVLPINGAGASEPLGGKVKLKHWTLRHTTHESQFEVGRRSKCKRGNNTAFRRKPRWLPSRPQNRRVPDRTPKAVTLKKPLIKGAAFKLRISSHQETPLREQRGLSPSRRGSLEYLYPQNKIFNGPTVICRGAQLSHMRKRKLNLSAILPYTHQHGWN